MIEKAEWLGELPQALRDTYSSEFQKLFGGHNDEPPNWKEIRPDQFWSKFSSYGVGQATSFRQISPADRKTPMLSVHLFHYSDGTGLGVHVDWKYNNDPDWIPTFYSFALCEHKRVSTLDTIRGWHEGYCEKCGMGMNYDSGD